MDQIKFRSQNLGIERCKDEHRNERACYHVQPHSKHSLACSHIALKRDSFTPLMIASVNSAAPKNIEFLITHGSDINCINSDAKNVPIISLKRSMQIKASNINFLKIFLKQPTFNINYQDALGNTYLIYLIYHAKYDSQQRFFEEIKILLDAGANPLITNKDGYSVFSYIDSTNQPELFNLLTDFVNKKQVKK